MCMYNYKRPLCNKATNMKMKYYNKIQQNYAIMHKVHQIKIKEVIIISTK